jgi:hypothetical protein
MGGTVEAYGSVPAAGLFTAGFTPGLLLLTSIIVNSS